MRLRFINQRVFMWLVWFRDSLLWLRTWYFRTLYGMNIAPDVRISFKARLDKTNPRCVEIGAKTYIAFDAIILAHDYATRRHGGQFEQKTRIGSNCFIGCAAIILPGVSIGDQVIVGAGSVVTKDVPAHSIVAGNPATVVRSGIQTMAYGRLA
ncbi:acyltransferase [Thiothrix nivea]|uniref:Transferase hexapeptide repeat containing protein n=1 Tax=Thiothrix nivea (strain ATCC 35100 / DSM 5205 / JP2) TaxID=870187 RepID=A0A656HK24_THINJ|nr:DapH/DapD/GlmU-related protein [Thiothrix nivea]EIJ36643.1 transferase hexapeptide repeat containing protein [Thiothrix nivea DSM 5205]